MPDGGVSISAAVGNPDMIFLVVGDLDIPDQIPNKFRTL
jgi:hypothetical protein